MENCTNRNMEVITEVRIYSVISLCALLVVFYFTGEFKLLRRCDLVFHFFEIKRSLDNLSFSLNFKVSM